jgi:hypothetical protein
MRFCEKRAIIARHWHTSWSNSSNFAVRLSVLLGQLSQIEQSDSPPSPVLHGYWNNCVYHFGRLIINQLKIIIVVYRIFWPAGQLVIGTVPPNRTSKSLQLVQLVYHCRVIIAHSRKISWPTNGPYTIRNRIFAWSFLFVYRIVLLM